MNSVIWGEVISTSSHIKQIGFNIRTKDLYVLFTNNSIYRYELVPDDTILAFLDATSYGTYFWNNIRGYYAEALV